ncbi:MAG: cation transporter [Chitinophagales bacterium]|jgi:cobalt-zinc-cadmium efflux system protein|nr:cation transporter [Chitinophagales bacterium]
MGHDHTHHHHHKIERFSNVLLAGVGLNALFVVVEASAGFFTGSLALLTDAGHNLSDVGSLLLSLLAFKLASIKPNVKYTYGYKKTTILATLINAVVLFVAVGIIFWEAIHRFNAPKEMPGITVAIVSFIGIIINGLSALLFFRDKDSDLNMKGAYLHLLADALVSFGVVIGGIAMYFTHLYWIDSILSVVICVVILISSFRLLKDSLRLSLDGIPVDVDVDKVEAALLGIKGVISLHHLHIWAMSTTENAMTVHVVLSKQLTDVEIMGVKKEIKHALAHQSVHHSTLEIESENFVCEQSFCC